MNKTAELTKRLKELGVKRGTGRGPGMAKWKNPWTIESCLAWLREKGFHYDIISLISGETGITIYNNKWVASSPVIVTPGHELEGLLGCMVKIVEGNHEKT